MRIYVDYDDILCETARACSRILFEEFGKRVAFEDIHSFNLGESFGLDDEELERLMSRVHHPDELTQYEPLPGAVEVLAEWSSRGYEIDVVTGRPAFTQRASRQWLEQYRIPYSSLTFVDKYHRPQDDCPDVPLLSLEELSQRDYCLAVDDAPKMIRHLCEKMSMPVVILDRPWNTALDQCRAIRCSNWAEIGRRFKDPEKCMQ